MMRMKIKRSKINKKGFTVLESLVAIALISTAISGTFAVVQANLSQSISIKDEVKAFYLAHEAVEIIRNKRDANQLDRILNGSSNSWLEGIAENAFDPCFFGKTCMVDAVSFSLSSCSGGWGSCPNLKQDPNNFIYGYNGLWPDSNFKREIQITSINPTEISIEVRVSWVKGSSSKQFITVGNLFDWI